MILKNVKSYKYARCFAKKSRNCQKNMELHKKRVNPQVSSSNQVIVPNAIAQISKE